jgi:predicted CXXCH cytochrome family protein
MTTLAKTALIAAFAASLLLLARFGPASASSRNPAEHSQADCARCHSLLVQTGETDPAALDLSTGCRGCHNRLTAADDPLRAAFHVDPNRPCTDCHSFHNTEMLTVSGKAFLFDFESSSTAFQCYACHTPGMARSNLSPGHQIAKILYHTDSRYLSSLTPSQTCMVCHTSGSSTSAIDMDGLRPPKFSRHAVHPVSVRVVPGSGDATNQIRRQLDPRLPLHEGRIECQSCHSLTAPTPKKLVKYEDSYDLCLGCHQHNP